MTLDSRDWSVTIEFMNSKFWDQIYLDKSEKEVSWYQQLPVDSLKFIAEFNLALGDGIIDVGGGESHLVNHLLNTGFKNVTVLDISAVALEKLRTRLGNRAADVKLVVSDITKFNPEAKYKLWHDRATFHFLNRSEDIETYLKIANQAIASDGYLVVSTFSKAGPEKCSGLSVSRYSDVELKQLFEKYFTNIRCFETSHLTPWGAGQSFVYYGFKKLKTLPLNEI